jgi:hypothetical protein
MKTFAQLKSIILKVPWKYRKILHEVVTLLDHSTSMFLKCPRSDLVFILGCQRSGTTLLGLILDSHPDITTLEEKESGLAIRNRKLPKGFVALKSPRWTNRYKILLKRFPNAKFLFIKRDVRAIASSMVKLKLGSKSWFKKVGEQEFEECLKGKNKNMKDFLVSEFKTAKKNNELAKQAVLCAISKTTISNELKQLTDFSLEINYEDLVKQPYEVISGIVKFLNIDWNDKLLKHHKSHSGIVIGQTDSSRPIDTKSIDGWRKSFTQEEQENIDALLSRIRYRTGFN